MDRRLSRNLTEAEDCRDRIGRGQLFGVNKKNVDSNQVYNHQNKPLVHQSFWYGPKGRWQILDTVFEVRDIHS